MGETRDNAFEERQFCTKFLSEKIEGSTVLKMHVHM
jgi:hypothetical protein